MAIKTMEQMIAENEIKRAQRQAKWEANRQYNADVRAELHDNYLENLIAYHEDCKQWQMKRARLTGIFFPGIAASQGYQTFVAHNISKHDRKINKLQIELDGGLYGGVTIQQQPVQKVKAEIVPQQ